MKRALFLTICVAAMMVSFISAQAQTLGAIRFSTVNETPGFAQVFDTDGTTPLAGTGFSAQLWGSTSSNPATFVALGTPQTFATGPLAGFVGAGAPFGPAAVTYQVSGTTGGTPFFYQMRVWNNQGGTVTSFDSALIRGASGVTPVALGGSDGVNPTVPTPDANTHLAFSLAAVPEPSTIALGVLGGLVLMFRRRK
jgi:hypothetical protein